MPRVTRLVSRSRSRIPSSSLPYFLARDRLRFQLRHRFEPRFDLRERNFRAQHPASQQARTHARRRLVDGRQQRRRASSSARSLDQLQISRGHLIENHRVLLLVIRDAVEVLEPSPAGRRDGTTAASSGFRAPIADVSRK